MRANRNIRKGISMLLILVFMQKAGGGLFLHNFLHFQKIEPVSDVTTSLKHTISSCSCIEDFYVPFTETPQQTVHSPCRIHFEFVTPHSALIPFSAKFFHSLRGPPREA
ncbi:MAG TPA: hypothetical protein VK498_04950 [Ferruginibacter sp.]|nr:hypothetical protein [Ferruginibacter sp.]